MRVHFLWTMGYHSGYHLTFSYNVSVIFCRHFNLQCWVWSTLKRLTKRVYSFGIFFLFRNSSDVGEHCTHGCVYIYQILCENTQPMCTHNLMCSQQHLIYTSFTSLNITWYPIMAVFANVNHKKWRCIMWRCSLLSCVVHH